MEIALTLAALYSDYLPTVSSAAAVSPEQTQVNTLITATVNIQCMVMLKSQVNTLTTATVNIQCSVMLKRQVNKLVTAQFTGESKLLCYSQYLVYCGATVNMPLI